MKLRGLVVFHANQEAFRDAMFFQHEGPDKLLNHFNEGKYNPVALLGPKHSLEDAFAKTNHIDSDWQDNEGVREINQSSGKRSTSVGDIVLDTVNNKAYAVANVGFKELDIEKLDFDEQLGVAKNLIRRDQHREASLGRSMG